MSRRWTKEEEEYLEELYSQYLPNDLDIIKSKIFSKSKYVALGGGVL